MLSLEHYNLPLETTLHATGCQFARVQCAWGEKLCVYAF